ncbi:MAG: sodium/solute symporter [Melioribacteraceae bacterium]|nr:sodium/solute symporter [Melioribacteraceae bacterium]WKZ70838.1 MAG: sodium/solute symporter [Melioribacteraceae bacterium]
MIENISFIDNIVIIIYFGIVLLIGIYHQRSKIKNSEDYFLAGRKMGWIAVGTSLFATNISSEHLIGLAGTGSTRGLSVGQFEWLAVFILIILGYVFAPIFLRSKVFTVPEFFGQRFDQRSRTYLAAISVTAYFFTKIAVTLLAASYLLKLVLGWDMFASTVLIVLLTGLYTIVGGLHSVIKTQLFQAGLLIFGAFLLVYYGISQIGGFSALTEQLPNDYFTLFKPIDDPDFPWTGIIFGAPILAIWYWCTDQYIVQRILSAKGIEHARKGTLLAGFLKIFPIFLFILPGMIAVVLFPGISGNEAYTYLLTGNLLPVGIKGIVISGLFAALMSSLSSAFNSSATLIANDFYKPRKPEMKDEEFVLVGRLATTIIVILTICLIPLLKMMSTDIYLYLQTLQAYISPPIASVFLIGIFWRKVTASAAIIALITGGFLGFIKILLSIVNPSLIGDLGLLTAYSEINYLHFATMLFVVTSVVLVIASLVKTQSIQEGIKTGEFVFRKNDLATSWTRAKIKN